MSRTNDESYVRPQLEEKAQRELKNPMVSLQKDWKLCALGMGEAPLARKERPTPR